MMRLASVALITALMAGLRLLRVRRKRTRRRGTEQRDVGARRAALCCLPPTTRRSGIGIEQHQSIRGNIEKVTPRWRATSHPNAERFGFCHDVDEKGCAGNCSDARGRG
jgi:hypothetical protein